MELRLPDIIQARKRVYIKSTIGLCCSTVNTIIETYQTSTTGLHYFHFRRPDILSYTNKQYIHIQVSWDPLMITGNIWKSLDKPISPHTAAGVLKKLWVWLLESAKKDLNWMRK